MPKLQFDGAPQVFDQMTSDQAYIGPLHTLYHHLGRWKDLFYLTRPSEEEGPFGFLGALSLSKSTKSQKGPFSNKTYR